MFNLKTIETLEKIYNYFENPDENQRKKLEEEAQEFLDEYRSIHCDSQRLDSEIADLLILCLQLYLKSKGIQEHFENKLERTNARIDFGYYPKNPNKK